MRRLVPCKETGRSVAAGRYALAAVLVKFQYVLHTESHRTPSLSIDALRDR